MTRERAIRLGWNTPRTPEGIADAIQSACELEAAAVREECATTIEGTKVQQGDHYAGYLAPSQDSVQLAEAIRSLGSRSAFDEFERKVREDEANWWKGKFWAYLESHHGALTRTMAEERLAALKPPASVEKKG